MWSMLPNEAMYPYTAKEARDRGELELWRANFRTNCACAGAIELAIHRDFDGMHLKDGCAKSVIDQYGYKRVGYVLANTLQLHAYDGRYATPEHAARPVAYASRQELFLSISKRYSSSDQPAQAQQASATQRKAPRSAMGLYSEDTRP